MKTGKIIIPAVTITILDTIVGAVTCGGVFNWVYRLEPTNVWKAMDGPPGLTYYVGALILNVILVMIYAALKNGLPGTNKIARGLVFGFFVWTLGTLPGMFATYMFMNVATTVVIYWTISALILTPIKGLVIAAMYET